MTLIGQIFRALAEFLHWRRLQAELDLRRQLRLEIEHASDAIDDLRDEVATARSAGLHELADRELRKATDLVRYRAGLRALGSRADVHSGSEDDAGDGGGDPGKGRTNPESTAGE